MQVINIPSKSVRLCVTSMKQTLFFMLKNELYLENKNKTIGILMNLIVSFLITSVQ